MSRSLPPLWVSKRTRARLERWRGWVLAALRMAFGLLWVVNAWCASQPGAISALQQSLAGAAQKPTVVALPWQSFWLHIAITEPDAVVRGVVLIECLIALGLLCGGLMNLTCGMGIALSLFGWSTRDLGLVAPFGLNMLAGDTGIALVCILAFAGLSLGRAGLFVGLDSRWSMRLGPWALLASGRPQPAISADGPRWTTWQAVEQAPEQYLRYPIFSRTGGGDGIRQQEPPVVSEQILSSRKRA